MCLEGVCFIVDVSVECMLNGYLWNVMIIYYGVLMMFFVVILVLFGGFGNYFMLLYLGVFDMVFLCLNNLFYWMYVCGVVFGIVLLLVLGGSD